MSKKAVLQSNTHSALYGLMRAIDALMSIDHDAFPHVRRAIDALEDVQKSLVDNITANPQKVKMTAIVALDSRDMDAPMVIFVEAESANDFLIKVRDDFYARHCDDATETAVDFWKEQGARMIGVLPGHVQIRPVAPVHGLRYNEISFSHVEIAFDNAAQGGA